ncbi:MAG: ribosome silencing factor [Bacteroidota bacterium]
MNTQKKEKPQHIPTEALNDLIIDSIHDIKGKDVIKLDTRHLHDAPTDFFIICHGESHTQVKAIADNIYKRVKTEGQTIPTHFEGQQHSQWILLDYFDTVVHIFYHETRSFYELEDLWSDAIFTEYQNL